eukprot:scaffold8291_cov64-Phaeocystis_antarctica.AAC.6
MPVAQSSLHECSGAWPIVSIALVLLEHLSHCLRRADGLRPCPLNIDVPRRGASGEAGKAAGGLCFSGRELSLLVEQLRQLGMGVSVGVGTFLRATKDSGREATRDSGRESMADTATDAAGGDEGLAARCAGWHPSISRRAATHASEQRTARRSSSSLDWPGSPKAMRKRTPLSSQMRRVTVPPCLMTASCTALTARCTVSSSATSHGVGPR